MIEETVKLLAEKIKIPVKNLLQSFSKAGVSKTERDVVTSHEKELLLLYLNLQDGVANQKTGKLMLKRKIKSTLNILNSSGKNKSVNVVVRKKRAYFNDKIFKKVNILETKVVENTEKIENKLEKEKKQKNVVLEKDKVKKIRNNTSANKFQKEILNYTEKKLREVKSEDLGSKIKLKNQVTDKIEKKAEEENKIFFEENHHAVKKFNFRKKQNNNENIKRNNFHITTFRHAQEIEDKNNSKKERGSKNKFRKLISKKKRNNKGFLKNFKEERVINRIHKSKNKKIKSLLQQTFIKPISILNRDVVIGETISVIDLANKMAVKGSQVVKTLIKMGVMVTINQVIDQETAQIVAEEMGHKVTLRRENELEEEILSNRNIDRKNFEIRPPIVTIMGHVDHGKTSLLDYVRNSKVACSEVGGITQHIGAYYVTTKKGKITFLDTPGHVAFTAMRARGARVTDIVVLVVAADDGVMPQTIEAIQHAQAAKVQIIVAINKVDKENVSVDRIKKQLSQHGIISEEWGGENQFVNISAKTGFGIEELLNAILLQAEILELKVARTGMAKGVVIESYLDKGRGPIATVLVQEGTLNKGDILLCGFEYGKVRAMRNELGEEVESASPSIPVEVLGLSNVPLSGDVALVVHDEKKAREVALYRQEKFREIKLSNQNKLKIKNAFLFKDQDKVSKFNIVLKADMKGSCEAIIHALKNLSLYKTELNIVSAGVGSITETDVVLAITSKAIIVGFNVKETSSAKKMIRNENLIFYSYSVIYDLIDGIKQEIHGIRKPQYKTNVIGLAEVRDVFKSPKFGKIAGCFVLEGLIKKDSFVRLLRNDVIIYESKISSLRRFKDDVNEVRNGMECGISITNYNDLHVGDTIEIFEKISVRSFVQ